MRVDVITCGECNRPIPFGSNYCPYGCGALDPFVACDVCRGELVLLEGRYPFCWNCVRTKRAFEPRQG